MDRRWCVELAVDPPAGWPPALKALSFNWKLALCCASPQPVEAVRAQAKMIELRAFMIIPSLAQRHENADRSGARRKRLERFPDDGSRARGARAHGVSGRLRGDEQIAGEDRAIRRVDL